jgi:hypothetical protein
MYCVGITDSSRCTRALTESEVVMVGGGGALGTICNAIETVYRAAALISPTINGIVVGVDMLGL